jgi:hypothetical protein
MTLGRLLTRGPRDRLNSASRRSSCPARPAAGASRAGWPKRAELGALFRRRVGDGGFTGIEGRDGGREGDQVDHPSRQCAWWGRDGDDPAWGCRRVEDRTDDAAVDEGCFREVDDDVRPGCDDGVELGLEGACGGYVVLATQRDHGYIGQVFDDDLTDFWHSAPPTHAAAIVRPNTGR